MPRYSLARFAVRADARAAAEAALFEHTSAVRRDQPALTVTVYRDPAQPTRYTALIRADDAAAEAGHRGTLADALAPYLDGALVFEHSELVTSSDLQRRPPRR
ncbi:MAG: hypothetical protein KBG28_05785 [Kofleriaceae bacterium]|jgi:quinol monooxygenase YgiN|nr:hypothetical protein [Kofleriaceae bacterium]MBP6837045.1 hypothetical protein [Kofleriaceae bacterium]MBP9203456.1 hypothetical protein [Kofleriaceae bacterium]